MLGNTESWQVWQKKYKLYNGVDFQKDEYARKAQWVGDIPEINPKKNCSIDKYSP